MTKSTLSKQKTLSRVKVEEKSLLDEYDVRDFPIVSKILRKLTPTRIKKEIETVKRIELPVELQEFINEYKKVSPLIRNDYVWKWLFRTASAVVLPTVEKKYIKSLIKIKFLIFFFTGLLDDVADKKKLRNKKLLDELLKIPLEPSQITFSKLTQREKKYIRFTAKVFHYIEHEIRKYPKYKELQNIFNYDILQLLNSIRYAYLVNENFNLINWKEYYVYLCHNMTVFVNITLDLMCSPKFDIDDLNVIRKIAWKTQEMMRIANWLSTWEREIHEDDFTSGVFAYAIDSKSITVNNLKEMCKNRIIKKIKTSRIEEKLFREWERNYREFKKIQSKIKSMPMNKIYQHLKETSKIILFYHLSSRATMNL